MDENMKELILQFYLINTTVAMPKPGKLPLNRFGREKGPVYLYASLKCPQSAQPLFYRPAFLGYPTHALARVSFAGGPAGIRKK